MSLFEKSSTSVPRNFTRLNLQTSIGSGTHLFSERNENGTEHSAQSVKITPKPQTSFSVFDEGSCGEPQRAQHLVIDFAHNELDNDFVQKKCCAFWEFVNSQPELQHMMVMPDSEMFPSTTSSTSSDDISTEISEKATTVSVEESEVKEHTAVSMLDFVSREGMIDKSFEAKIPQSFCPLGSREYLENQTPRRAPKKIKPKLPAVCRCGGVCNTCVKIPTEKEKVTQSSDEVIDMCENLKKWDVHHPKSMEPPGHALPLIHCVMQRKVS